MDLQQEVGQLLAQQQKLQEQPALGLTSSASFCFM